MNKLFLRLTFLLMLTICGNGLAATIIDFNSLSPATPAALPGTGNYFDGYGSGASPGSWAVGGVTFNTGQFGPGWSYSNVNNIGTGGFLNQWSAVTGFGVGETGNYAMAYYSEFADKTLGMGVPYINLPSGFRFASTSITNSTYAALSMRFGDANLPNSGGDGKKFGGASGNDPDFLKATLTGYDSLNATGTTTGEVEVFLADFRSSDNSQDYVLATWLNVDLAPLGLAKSAGLRFTSSDVGAFGINTPTYLALDDLRITAVPEPGSLLVIGAVAFAFVCRYRRR